MEKKKYEKPRISREQLEQQLLEANESLLEANRLLQKEEENRTEFLSNLSHDLRSPLSAVMNSVECLKAGNTTPQEEAEILNLMSRRLQNMQTLINDIFLLTKIEGATISLHMEEVDLGMFLEEFFYSCEADEKYEERELRLCIPENFSVRVKIDPQQMTRVLDNLFDNARKYSGAGATIRLEAAKSDCDGKVTILVRDTGIGIAKEDLERIFERSFRVTKARTATDTGSGFGLAIAKGIVEMQDGKIICESELGVGSSFFVELPTVK